MVLCCVVPCCLFQPFLESRPRPSSSPPPLFLIFLPLAVLLSHPNSPAKKLQYPEAGVSPEVEVSVWEWQGTFLQLSAELDAAMSAYERCGKAAEAQGKPYPADCLIKMGWVKMEKEDTDAVRALNGCCCC